MFVPVELNGQPVSTRIYNYLIESSSDVSDLPTSTTLGANGEETCSPGSMAYSADLSLIYILGPDDEWHQKT